MVALGAALLAACGLSGPSEIRANGAGGKADGVDTDTDGFATDGFATDGLATDGFDSDSTGGGPVEAPPGWTHLPDAPLHFLHAALLPTTGELLLYSGYFEPPHAYRQEISTFDPDTETYEVFTMGEDMQTADLLCSHHVVQPDGRVLIMGGGGSAVSDAETWSWMFDPASGSLEPLAPMATPRWYPTALMLPDGRTLAASGTFQADSPLEVWDPGAQMWLTLAGSDEFWPHLYPAMHVLPSGDIFASRVGWRSNSGASRVFQFDGPLSGSWIDAAPMEFPNRNEGTSLVSIDDTVDPPNTTITVLGGGGTDFGSLGSGANPRSVEQITITDDVLAASWRRLPDMHEDRTNADAKLLPDGRILVIGGRRGGKFNDQQAVMTAELFDPDVQSWDSIDGPGRVRQYHQVSLLMPDGRVFVGGGIDAQFSSQPPEVDTETAEYYEPEYLQAPRPVIESAPSHVGYGETFEVEVDDAERITEAVMITPSSITHHTDAGGRRVVVPITGASGTTVQVRGPSSAGVLPPGFQMLFLLDADGVPSAAVFMTVG